MNNFFDKLNNNKKKKNIIGGRQGGNRNPLANVGKALGGGNRSFQGGGQSLGGSRPGRVLQVTLPNPGPLGMKIEKRPNGEASAIVSMVVEGSQAAAAGLQRGDILCYGGTNGEVEINYKQFLALASSTDRPLVLDIRRIDTKTASSTTSSSADAFAKRQAVIAAAEARERKHKAKEKPISRTLRSNTTQHQQPQLQQQQEFSTTPMSEEARRAVQAAKSGESQLAAQLGYNPYETNKATAGQARTATVAMTHGSVGGGGGGESSSSSSAAVAPSLPQVAPPRDLPAATDDDDDKKSNAPVSVAFQEAFELLVTSNSPDTVRHSLSIMRKLVTNATTKGQQQQQDGAKFRRVRLSNAKIQQAIGQPAGAVDLMMSTGFQLVEDQGESYLVFPLGTKGPPWLSTALQQMQQYETSS